MRNYRETIHIIGYKIGVHLRFFCLFGSKSVVLLVALARKNGIRSIGARPRYAFMLFDPAR